MPRKSIRLQDRYPYHVTARSNNQEWFHVSPPMAWALFLEGLSKVKRMYGAEPLEFVLMSNHFHLIIQTPAANLDRIMNHLQRGFSRSAGRISGRINHVFGGRYKGTLIDDPVYFAHAYKYVLRNPVAAGIVESVEMYSYSSFWTEHRGTSSSLFKTVNGHELSRYIPQDLDQRLKWLNQPYPTEQAKLLHRALKKRTFALPSHRRHQAAVRMFQQVRGT